MRVSDDVVAPLRAQLSGRLEEHRRPFAQLAAVTNGRTTWHSPPAASFAAVERRWDTEADDTEVVGFALPSAAHFEPELDFGQ